MLKKKEFWIGFFAAYLLAVWLPPAKLMAKGKKNKGS